jgi:hypothetical protein
MIKIKGVVGELQVRAKYKDSMLAVYTSRIEETYLPCSKDVESHIVCRYPIPAGERKKMHRVSQSTVTLHMNLSQDDNVGVRPILLAQQGQTR